MKTQQQNSTKAMKEQMSIRKPLTDIEKRKIK